MKMHPKGAMPPAKEEQIGWLNHLCLGMARGTGLVSTGCCTAWGRGRGRGRDQIHTHISREALTGFRNPRKDPKKVRGREMPNQRPRRVRRAVRGMTAEDPAVQRRKFRNMEMAKTIPGTSSPVRTVLVFHSKPPITEEEGWGVGM